MTNLDRVENYLKHRDFEMECFYGSMAMSPEWRERALSSKSPAELAGILEAFIDFHPGAAEAFNARIKRLLGAVESPGTQERLSRIESASGRLGPNAESLKQNAPVDRSARVLASGSAVTDDHREINPSTGQQKDYVVLTADERAKGFVRPVRRTYIHVGLNPTMNGIVLIKRGEHGCGSRTTMAIPIAETYARDPEFYGGTFCCSCLSHRPLEEFVWEGTTMRVGS